jgi:5-methylcytosine-specific restriction protein A
MAFHDTAAWQKARSLQLKREPLCLLCMARGKLIPATEVDHIVRITDGGAPTLPVNLQSLCRPCHEGKSYAEQKGKDWRKHELRGCDEHGMPIDPEHAWQGNGTEH